MKATLNINGKEINLDLDESKLNELVKACSEEPTGYEEVKGNADIVYFVSTTGEVIKDRTRAKLDLRMPYRHHTNLHDALYRAANYYSDPKVAEADARADTLMRRLRRYEVEHRKEHIKYSHSGRRVGYDIKYDHDLHKLGIISTVGAHVGQILFNDSIEAQNAIDEFHEDLIWYFTKYLTENYKMEV